MLRYALSAKFVSWKDNADNLPALKAAKNIVRHAWGRERSGRVDRERKGEEVGVMGRGIGESRGSRGE
jgi:hypothetical protein